MGNSIIFAKLRKRRLKVIFFFLFIFLSFSASGQGEAILRLHFIDVGEGDAILIEAPDGETCLVDAGNLISGFRAAEYLKENGIRNLDYLIFTHPDPDHIGGAFFILQMLEVGKVFDNGEDLTGASKSFDLYRWYEELVRESKNYNSLRVDDNLPLGKIILKVLWPPKPPAFSDFNANSLVIMVEYGKFRCLLTGDLNTAGERMLLKKDIDLMADVLKIGHHGAGDASCPEFLRKVSPEIAIISVNKANIRGYPANETIDRLKNEGIKLYRTDRDGDIILDIHLAEDKVPEIRVK